MTEEEKQIIRKYNEHRKSILRSTTEPRGVRILLIALSVLFMSLFLFVPLVSIFYEAFRSGAGFFFRAVSDRAAMSALTSSSATGFRGSRPNGERETGTPSM